MRAGGFAALLLVLSAAATAPASAQTPPDSPAWRPWRPLISLGAGWLGADDLGRVTATSRVAAVGTATPAAAALFDVTSTLGGAARAEVGVAVPVTSTVLVEVFGTMARPTLTSAISGDLEGAPDTDATEDVDEYTIGGRLIYDLRRWTVAGRVTPFVTAGGAYLRQLHDGQVLVETGQVWSGALGARLWLRPARPGRRGALGATLEGGWNVRSGGIAFDDGTRTMPSLSLRVFAGF